MVRGRIEVYFPGLRDSEYRVTSPEAATYNCIAWAAGDSRRWWWPTDKSFWPKGAPRKVTVTAFVRAFGTYGYVPCESPSLEDGFEKVAIYVKDGRPTHAARQLPTGKWTSKLGPLEDIEHSLRAIEGDQYGSVAQILRRERRSSLALK